MANTLTGPYKKTVKGRDIYLYAVRYVDPATGDMKRKEFTAPRTRAGKTAAQANAQDFFDRIERGGPVRDATSTVGEWITQWLEVDLAVSDLGPSTKKTYVDLLTKHVVNSPIGEIRIDRLTFGDYLRWLKALKEDSRGTTKGGEPLPPLSSATISKTVRQFRKAMDATVAHKLLAANPLEQVKVPRAVNKKERNLSNAELDLVFAHLPVGRSSVRVLLEFVRGTGARKGEAIGMRWPLVDLDNHCVYIEATSDHFGDRDTKTTSGRRRVPISKSLAASLRAERLAQKQRELKAHHWTKSDLVFTTETGEAHDGRNVLRAIERAAIKAGLMQASDTENRVNVHTLRHSYATLLMQRKVHPVEVARLLGHADTRMLNTYVGRTQEYTATVADVIDNLNEEDGPDGGVASVVPV